MKQIEKITVIQKMLHSCLIKLIKLHYSYNIHILNEQPEVGQNAIYVVNHSCKDDFPLTCEVIGKHTYVLVGKQCLRIIDRICFRLNGVVYVNRKNKESRKNANKIIRNHLLKGHNMCVYPEGTWNLTPSKPMLPLYWGIIDIARKTSCPIVPLVLEYKGYECYAKWGTPIYVNLKDNKKDKINELSDKMATLKWDIWESFPVISRKSIDSEEWNREIQRRLDAYPYLDYEYEKTCVLKFD